MIQFNPHLSISNRGSDRLGRYYTNADVGGLLIEQMANLFPTRVLDLGAGAGSLSRAALRHWANIELLTVDIDTSAIKHLENLAQEHPSAKHNHIHADALSNELPFLVAAQTSSIDAAVCNPPFLVPKWKKGFAEILEDAGFSGCFPMLSNIDAALLFLAQNLRLLSRHGTLGIILPDSLISAAKYQLFRKELLNRYVVHKAIRLPRHSFQRTDAQAHILIIGKHRAPEYNIPLQQFNPDLGLSPILSVNTDDAIRRLDFSYHSQKTMNHSQSSLVKDLGQISAEIKRGAISKADANKLGMPVFHTTDMTSQLTGKWWDLQEYGVTPPPDWGRFITYAEPGDILLARVGRNLERKLIGVERGYPIITDCVSRIRVPRGMHTTVFQQLNSPSGQAWLASRTYGVSAKQLSKADLLTFPVVL